ncbi:MAG: GIY-YIG nuclease family protein [Chloroflexi bacterium]|nr:GIY-YIG nuclease family protein [Chloroflexota bacterium]
MNLPVEPGTYILLLHLPVTQRIIVGRLGELHFPCGYYLYVGSALNGLHHRLRRHLRHDKPLRWHIDYLRREAEIIDIWYALGREHRECPWATALAAWAEVKPHVARFGASDCRCTTHLFYSPTRPASHALTAPLRLVEPQLELGRAFGEPLPGQKTGGEGPSPS